jgi:protein TonB
METQEPTSDPGRRNLIVGVIIIALLIAMAIWGIHRLMGSKTSKAERVVQNITVIRPPPPPPEETPPPPPPEKVDEPIPQDQPTPQDEAPAQPQQLGLDAEGAAGDDGFGLAARKGGGDLVGNGGAIFAWYTAKVKDFVQDRLQTDIKLRGKKYSVAVRIWIESDGRIRDVKLAGGSGNRDIDLAIASDLTAAGRLTDTPPIELPQPITLQIVSRS